MNCKEVSIPYAHLFLRFVKSNLSGCFCFCPKIFTKTFTTQSLINVFFGIHVCGLIN